MHPFSKSLQMWVFVKMQKSENGGVSNSLKKRTGNGHVNSMWRGSHPKYYN